MSDFYILASLDENAPKIDIDRFVDALVSTWNVLNIRKLNKNEKEILTWDMDIDGSIVTAYLGNDRNSLSLDGAIQPIAKFVVWYKTHLFKEHRLLLFEQSYQHGTLEISNTMTEEEIIEVFWS